ncbi:hypothetical protein MAR_036082 [Mya arenaria]|uniref:Cadherin domain-containing protein n=1 Tax=Mya arenaria TaxID=6604 RepID=A0ABY7EUX6_MYAAR|nr:hypothetical protein MAR_036082 [Mya arenaria]
MDAIQDDSKQMTHEITVRIVDVNEPPSFPDDGPWLNGAGVADGAGPETLVCSVEAKDPDKYAPNNVLNYYISTPATPFTISDLGEITVATGQTTHHEKTVVWNIEVVVTDAGVPQHTASTTVLIVVCPTRKPDSPKPCA